MTNTGRRHEFVDTAEGPYNGGLFQGLGETASNRSDLNAQRRQEYNDRMEQVRVDLFVTEK